MYRFTAMFIISSSWVVVGGTTRTIRAVPSAMSEHRFWYRLCFHDLFRYLRLFFGLRFGFRF